MKLQALGETVSMWHCTFLVRQCWLQWQFKKEDAQYQQQFLLFKTMRVFVSFFLVEVKTKLRVLFDGEYKIK